LTDRIDSMRTSVAFIDARSIIWRIRQFIASASSRRDAKVDTQLRQLVANELQWSLLAQLGPFDRSHHLKLHQELIARGYSDPDLLLAALLHDVGKADERGRAGVGSRSLRVLLRRFPFLLARLTAEDHPRVLHGLYLVEHHARLGAAKVSETGASEYCCFLIARHEDSGSVDDPLLEALITADDEVIR
jgi:hypothetical protein